MPPAQMFKLHLKGADGLQPCTNTHCSMLPELWRCCFQIRKQRQMNNTDSVRMDKGYPNTRDMANEHPGLAPPPPPRP
jgi:hypothetical protein